MNDQMQAAMAEATHLTRTGRLAEATALIQRTLGGMSAPAGRSTRADAPNEAVVRVVEVTPLCRDQRYREELEHLLGRPVHVPLFRH